MLRRLYDWIIGHAAKPYAIWVMMGVSFAESSFFPLPPDLLLIPMILASRRHALWLATAATVSSVVGGYLGYGIGYFVFNTIGEFLIVHMSSMDRFAQAQSAFDHYGFWLIVIKGLTPIPYKIVTILCGVMHYDLTKFTVASIFARGLRFYPEAILLYYFGVPVQHFIERHLVWVTTAFAVLLVGAFVALKYL